MEMGTQAGQNSRVCQGPLLQAAEATSSKQKGAWGNRLPTEMKSDQGNDTYSEWCQIHDLRRRRFSFGTKD